MVRSKTKRSRSQAEQVVGPSGPQPLFEFCRLSDEHFEECCCHIFYYELGVKNPDLFGRPRQKQFGADTVADRCDGSGIEAVSSKCYQSVRKGQINTFVNEFLDHWNSHWSEQRVRRFVLCVACDLRSAERRAEIATEKKRFDALDVEFEVWPQRPLSHKLHEHPELIRTYFPDYYRTHFPQLVKPHFADISPAQGNALLSSATVTQIAGLQTTVEQDVVTQLDGFQTLLKLGHRSEADNGLAKLRTDAIRWSSLSAATQARLLRMQALVALKASDQSKCVTLLDEADAISPVDEPRIRALLVLQTKGWDAALRIIEHPTTKDGALLRAGLLIEARRIPEATDLLAEWNSLKGNDAEWHRLCAYIACIEHRAAGGLAEIFEAERLAPNWLAVIETGAIVRYAAALSPAVEFHGGAMPEPLSIVFAKQDDASRQRLQEAYGRFDKLTQTEGELPWRQRLEIWRFACLAQMSGKETEAEAACMALLKQQPIAPVAIFWALDRGYALDLKDTIRRLETRLRDPQSSIDDLQAAVACAMTNSDPKKAAAILKRHAARFSRDPTTKRIADDLASRVTGKRAQQTSLQVSADPYDRLDTLIRAARVGNDWAPIDTFLETMTDRAEILWLGCSALCSNRQWNLVLKRSARLLDFIGTAEAARVVAIATYNVGQHEQVIKLLESHAHFFPGSQLPLDLQRLKAYATAKRGDLYTALPIAADLASKSADHRDRALLVDLLIQAGDVNRAALHLRNLLPLRNWSASELLRWAPSISNEEPELARTLVRMATAVDTQHTHGTTIIDLNYRLGLDKEASELLGVLQANPSSTTLRKATLNELLEYLKQRQVTNEEMGRRYLHGSAPIHILAGPAGINMAELWDACFNDRNGGAPLFIRSGNRAERFFPQRVQGTIRLHLDVTAILTVHQCDLLEALDSEELTITFPHTLLPLLQSLEREARPIQPSRIPILETVLDGVTAGKIRVWQSNTVSDSHAVHVSHELPPPSNIEGQPPVQGTATLGAIADELIRRRGASAQEIAEIRTRSGSWKAVGSNVNLDEIEALIFEGNTIDVAIESGLLDRLRTYFSVWIEPDHHTHCVADLNHIRNGNAIAEKLRAFRRRLAQGVQDGRYRVLPQPSDSALHRSEHGAGYERLLPLYELLSLPTSENAWLWIDDRNVTSFTSSSGNNIVSTYEILEHLRYLGKLDDARYYALLGRMRAANVQILPIHEDEVLYALQQPFVGAENDRLVETPPLTNLRRAFNRLLKLEPGLDLEPPQREPGKPIAEIACLLQAFGMARRCLEEIWTDTTFPDGLRVPASDWTWESFRIGQFLRIPIGADTLQKRHIGKMEVVMEILVALSISWRDNGSDESLRTRYLDWLQTKLVDLTGRGDHSTVVDIASQLARFIVDLLKPDEPRLPSGTSPEDVRTYVGLFVNAMPVALREHLYADAAIVSVLKLDIRTVVNLDDIAFEAISFWNSAATARTGSEVSVTSVRGSIYSLRYGEKWFELLKGTQRVRFTDEELVLLSNDIEERRAYLRTCHWLGESNSDHLVEVERIATLPLPAERMETLHQWRQENPSARYEVLRKALKQKSSFSMDALAAGTAESYVRYLGLIVESGTVAWEASARSLIERFDIFELLNRWSGLPIALPKTAIQEFFAAPSERRAMYFNMEGERPLPPLQYLRAVELARATSSPDDEARALHICLARWTDLSPVFLTVLQWSERLWKRDRSWNDLPVSARLAVVWAHADRILRIFLDDGSTPETIKVQFSQFHASGICYALPYDHPYDGDVASPSRLTTPILLATSLNAALNADAPDGWKEEQSTLNALLTLATEKGQVWPLMHLFADRRAGSNSLKSYLAHELHPWLAESFGRHEVQPLTCKGQEAFLASLLTDLELAPTDVNLWAMLAVVGVQWLSEESLVRLDTTARRLQFPDAGADQSTRQLWHVVSDAIPYLSNDCHFHIQQELIQWARRLSQVHIAPVVSPEGGSPASKDADIVINVALTLSRRGRLKQSLDELGTVLADLSWAWPALVPSLRDLLNRTFEEVPLEDTEGLWRTLVMLRAMK